MTSLARFLAASLVAFTFAACGAPEEVPSSDQSSGDVVSTPCMSTAQCGTGEVCTTEDGVCNPPPGCGPGVACPAVCYGTCRPKAGTPCGSKTCGPGTVCCNASCGICTPPDGACTQQVCPPPPNRCKADADCRKFSDYCVGCNCRALSVCQPDPTCPTPGVQCFVDPCFNKEAFCNAGTCALRPATPTCPVEKCGPRLGMPNYLCPDGKTVAGPTNRCLQRPGGICGWEVTSCPDPRICTTL